MFRFNRFYLLFALVFSYVIPFVKINLPAASQQKSQLIFDEIPTQQLIQNANQTSQFDWINLIFLAYFLVCILLIIKSIISIRKIISLKGIDINYQNLKVKLLEKNLPPFSFWNKIYLNKNYFENQQIDNRIFQHEKTHIVQKHSLDILFLEILKVFSWFNPALYFYKKAMTDNHEFLADETIIKQQNNIKDYQQLILSEILQTQNLNLTHQFNYNKTKKRFIMMTTKKSKFEKTKKLFAVSAFAGLSILFVQKIYASEIETISPSIPTEITINNFNNLDTIPQRIEAKTNVKLKNSKKVKTPPTPKEFKENELPIPPPPPPARNLTNAEFPEGLNNLRKGIAEAFDSSSFDGKKGTIKTNLFITINKYGETVDVKPDGDNQKFNEEAIKAFKTATQGKTWKPATEDGKEATTVFQLPVTMQFL
ncbi:M56 family metallopeptidase [Epilithonimonas sp.]|uniref:M56 family metallopeptidase n=1 Tax=Epilithonimonas sp. TaxID=2894511 RepID=UPI002898959A|nr:M56 family metallopeptidase [Epilithonimonas sp.]